MAKADEDSILGFSSLSKELGSLFWLAALGLGLEGCAGQFRQLVTFSYAEVPSLETVLLTRVICLVLAATVLSIRIKRREAFLFNSRVWPVAICIGFSLGLFCYFSNCLLALSVAWLPLAGYMIATCVGAFYLYVWSERMFTYGLRITLVIVGLGLIARAGFQLLLLLLQDIPSIFMVSIMPLLSLPCFLALFDRTQKNTSENLLGSGQASSAPSSLYIEHRTAAMVSLFVVIALLFVYGFIVEG